MKAIIPLILLATSSVDEPPVVIASLPYNYEAHCRTWDTDGVAHIANLSIKYVPRTPGSQFASYEWTIKGDDIFPLDSEKPMRSVAVSSYAYLKLSLDADTFKYTRLSDGYSFDDISEGPISSIYSDARLQQKEFNKFHYRLDLSFKSDRRASWRLPTTALFRGYLQTEGTTVTPVFVGVCKVTSERVVGL